MAELLTILKTPLTILVMLLIYHYGIARPEFNKKKWLSKQTLIINVSVFVYSSKQFFLLPSIDPYFL